ncbi:NEDD8-conjugating enzyme Ubc12 isoform X2 [Meleagris gallopavo]|uniref:NEDD8-conjugating enzyme Ubc12 isoform X2 n=1 Tax=Meleagris gallopavo TaxID=9103 RepID=UPI00093C38D3|nr:NEDD8-conjugating enzyme Ubc12 isoform X2 [Meleagris gallopavo]
MSLRVPTDINELNLPKTCEIDFSDQDDLLHFRLLICPDEGFYKGGKFVFSFKVGQHGNWDQYKDHTGTAVSPSSAVAMDGSGSRCNPGPPIGVELLPLLPLFLCVVPFRASNVGMR